MRTWRSTSRMSDRAFLAAIRKLNEEEAALTDGQPRRSLDGAKAIEYIRNFAASWAKAKAPTRATMIQSLYGEIVVRGAEFVSVRLSPEAYAPASRSPCRRKSWWRRCPRAAGHGQIWHWRARQDSNLRPSAPEADALSTELQAREAPIIPASARIAQPDVSAVTTSQLDRRCRTGRPSTPHAVEKRCLDAELVRHVFRWRPRPSAGRPPRRRGAGAGPCSRAARSAPGRSPRRS